MPGLSGGTGSAPLPLSREAARRAGLGPLRHVVETGSTNRDLAAEARRGEVGAGLLVADRQTAGRGRLDRHWRDAPGRSLLVSFRLPSLASEPFAPTAAVTAAARAAAAALLPVLVLSKWPNDLVIDDRPAPGKLAGVLSELVDGPRPVVIVGLGLNLGPVGDEPGATSLAQAGAVSADRDRFLAGLLGELPAYLDDPARARRELKAASATIGRRVRVERAGAPPLVGEARDIDRLGRLVMVAAGREHLVDAGDVVHLRPSGAP